jgi:hypothetical protein
MAPLLENDLHRSYSQFRLFQVRENVVGIGVFVVVVVEDLTEVSSSWLSSTPTGGGGSL